MPARRLVSVELALQRLARLLTGHDWRELSAFLPEDLGDALLRRSAVAASLIASLELARQGRDRAAAGGTLRPRSWSAGA